MFVAWFYAWTTTPLILERVTEQLDPGSAETMLGAGTTLGLLFTASWCAAGVLLVKEMAAQDPTVVPLVVVDVDAFPHLADRFQVRSLPTFLLLDGLKERGRLLGAFSASQVQVLLSNRAGVTR